MVEFSIGGVNVDIDLAPGTYTFFAESATGKTRLFDIVARMSHIDTDYIGYTDAGKSGLTYDYVFSKHRELIIFDRFTNYADSRLWELMQSIIDKTIMLVDAKTYVDGVGMPYKFCSIIMEERSIHVFR